MTIDSTIIAHCREFLPQWKDLDDSNFSTVKFTSTSNAVYLVTTTAPTQPSKVIYREFGAGEVINVSGERHVFERLGELGFGPRSYGSTLIYRVEEFLPGRALRRLELRDPNIVPLITTALKGLHSQDLSSFCDDTVPVTITHAENWRNICLGKVESLTLSTEDAKEVTVLLSDDLQRQYLDLLPMWAPLVFCHHDCNELNFLYDEEEPRVRPIDYEYSGYGFRGMDLAFTINETLYDYLYPNPPYWSYHISDLFDEALLTRYVKAYGGDEDLWTETRLCLCCGHYFWAVWALAMYKEGREGFNFLKYAFLRLHDFQREAKAIEEMGGIEGVRAAARTAMQGR